MTENTTNTTVTQPQMKHVAPMHHEKARLEELRQEWVGKRVQYRSKSGNWGTYTVDDILIDEILYGLNQGKRVFIALLKAEWGTFCVSTKALQLFEKPTILQKQNPGKWVKIDGKLVFVETRCICCDVEPVDLRQGTDVCTKCADEIFADSFFTDRKPSKRKHRCKALAS